MATIKVRENGPYRIDGDDVSLIDWNGVEYPVERRPIALCRCGASGKKPFCDGTHARVGFRPDDPDVRVQGPAVGGQEKPEP